MKRFALPLFQTATTVTLLFWMFSNGDLPRLMAATLRQAKPEWWIAGISLAGFGILVGIFRWGIFLRIQSIRISWRRTAQLSLIGLFFNLLLLGAVGGDVVKILYLAKDHPGKRHAIALTVVADRLSGLLALATCAAVFSFARRDWFAQNPVTAGMLYFLFGYVAFAVLGVAVSFLITRFGLEGTLLPNLPGRAHFLKLCESYHLFARAWKHSLAAALISFAGLLAHYGTFYCSGRAFEPSPSLLDTYSILPVVDVLAALPVAISGMGVREKAFEELLGKLSGIPSETAILISLTGFSFTVVWSLVGALLFPFYRGEHTRSLPKLRSMIKEPNNQSP